jgi:nucleotide-binding universal stress UspA family protein
MFQRILVPLDGSSRAENALPIAACLARATAGSLVLLRVVSTATALWPYMDTDFPGLQAAIDADCTEASQYLQTIATSSNLDGIPIEMVVHSAPVASTILSTAASSGADVIVMCSHGYTGMTRWVMGSIAERVVHHAQIPVLVLREDGPQLFDPQTETKRPMRVLVPLDGSQQAKVALRPALSLLSLLATPYQGELHLVMVVPSEMTGQAERGSRSALYKEVLLQANASLQTAEDECAQACAYLPTNVAKPTIIKSLITETDVTRGILSIAENHHGVSGTSPSEASDLIAMATHGRSGPQHWAMGSIAQRVLNATKLPVLMVRP